MALSRLKVFISPYYCIGKLLSISLQEGEKSDSKESIETAKKEIRSKDTATRD